MDQPTNPDGTPVTVSQQPGTVVPVNSTQAYAALDQLGMSTSTLDDPAEQLPLGTPLPKKRFTLHGFQKYLLVSVLIMIGVGLLGYGSLSLVSYVNRQEAKHDAITEQAASDQIGKALKLSSGAQSLLTVNGKLKVTGSTALNGLNATGNAAFGGTVSATQLTASGLAISGNSSVSGNLTATNISGTFTGTFAGDGRALQNIDASTLLGEPLSFFQTATNQLYGTLSDARLSSNVALLSGANVFTGSNQFAQDVSAQGNIIVAGNLAAASLTQNGNQVCDTSNNCLRAQSNNYYTQGGNSFGATALLGTTDAQDLQLITNGNARLTVSAGGAITASGTISAVAFAGSGASLTNLNANAITTGTLATAVGGTGVNGATAANGSLLIGNGSGYTLANLTQGSGISITSGAGAITIAVNGTICTTDGNCTGSGGVTSNGATSGTIALFTGAQTIGNSLLSQNGTTVTVAGSLAATALQGDGSALTGLNAANLASGIVASARLSGNYSGITGVAVLTSGSIDSGFGAINTTNAISTTAALQGNSLAIGSGSFAVNASGAITAASGLTTSGTVTLSSLNTSGVVHTDASGQLTTGAVALGTETSGDYVATLGTLSGLTVTGNNGAGSTPALSVVYGATVNTAAQGNTVLSFTGVGNLTGTVSGTAGAGITTNNLAVLNNPTFGGLVTASGGLTASDVSFSGSLMQTGTGSITLGSLSAGVLVTNTSGVVGSTTIDRDSSYLSGQTSVVNGGTGATTAAGALANLGAAASGANLDITSLSAVGSVGSSAQALTLQGNASTTLSATDSGFTTAVGFATPTANVTYQFAAAGTGNYQICTTAGNCNSGGGITTAGGTSGTIALFTGSQTLGNSVLSQSGTTVTVAGTLVASALQGSGAAVTDLNGTSITSGTVGVGFGGTGAGSFTNNGLIYGNGTGALQVTAAGSTGQCLVATTGSAPTWQNCSAAASGATPGGLAGGDLGGSYPNPTVVGIYNQPLAITALTSSNVLIYNGTNWVNASISGDVSVGVSGIATIANGAVTNAKLANSAVTVTAGSGLSGGGAVALGATTTLNVAFGALANTVVAGNTTLVCPSGTGNLIGGGTTITLGSGGTCSNLDVVSNPSFSSLSLTTALTVANGGTGATTAVDARTSLGAAASGANADITSLSAVTSLSNAGGALSIGNTSKALSLQGNASTILSATDSGFTTSIGFAAPTANVNYLLATATAGTYNICTSAGNCASTGGGVTTAGGSTGTIALFTGSQTIGNSVLSQSGTTVTVGGTVVASAFQGSGAALTNLNGTNIASGTVGVSVGGTGAGTFTTNGILYGNGTGALQVTAAGTSGQCLVATSGSAPTWQSCTAAAGGSAPGGAASGDLSGNYPNPTVVGIYGHALSITSLASSNVLIYNGTNWVNASISGDIGVSASGVATIGTGVVSNAKLANSSVTVTAGTGLSGGGAVSLGGTTSLSVAYGSTASTAVAGNTTLTCTSGTGNLSGGGNVITLGAGGSCGSLNVVANPSFNSLSLTTALTVTNGGTGATTAAAARTNLGAAASGANSDITSLSGLTTTLSAGQGGTGVNGSTAANGKILIGNGSGYTLANLAQGSGISITNGSGSISIAVDNTVCTTAGNCANAGGGVTTAGGTSGTIALFNGSQTIANSIITQAATTVTVAGTLAATALQGDGSAITGLNASNLASGTVASARISGNYSGITGVGALTAGSIGSGFGAISTGSAISTTAALQGNTLSIGSGSFAVNASGAITAASGITSSGSINFSSLNSVGVVHTNASGTLSTSAVSLGTDTSGSYVANLGTLTGLTTSGNSGAGSTPTLSVTYGAAASTAAQGNTALSFTGAGNLTGSVSGTAGGGLTTNTLAIVSSPTFSGSLAVQGAGGLSLGVAGTTTGQISFATTGSSVIFKSATQANNVTLSIPADTNTSDSLCLVSLGNCTGANGGSGNNSYIYNTTSQQAGANFNIAGNGVIGGTTTLSSLGAGIAQTNASGVVSSGTVDRNSANLTSQTSVANGGTGAATAAGGRTNLGAAASGANSDITSLSGVTSVANASAGLSVGNSGQALTLQGNASTTLSASASGYKTTVGFISPTANVTYNFDTAAAGSYTICTTVGNCAGTGGGIIGSGTNGTVALFTGSGSIGNSIITQSGTTVSVAGTLSATAFQGSGAALTNLNGTNIASGTVGVSVGGTGAGTFTTNGILYGNGTGALQVTAAGTSGQCLVAGSGGVPTFTSCSTAASGATPGGTAGGDLSGTYPNPTVIALYGTPLQISSLTSGNILVYNGSKWANVAVSGDIAISSAGAATIQNGVVTNAKLANSSLTVTAAGGITGGGTVALGGSITVSTLAPTTIGTLDGGTANASGATITSNVLYLQSASSSNAGLINTGAQTLAGAKTFSGAVNESSTLAVTGATTLGANLTISAGGANITGNVVTTGTNTIYGSQTVTTSNGGSSYSANSTLLTNTNTSSTASNIIGQYIALTGTANTNATNTLNGTAYASVTAATGNVFNAVKFGTGFNSLLSYNGNTVLNGTASVLTLGQGGSTSGALVLNNSSNTNAVTLSASTLQANSLALTIPADANATDTVCLVTLGNCGGAGAATTIGTLDGGTANANGATISNNTLYLQSAGASYAGLINTGAQTLAGAKTFNGAVTIGNTLTVNGSQSIVGSTVGAVTLNIQAVNSQTADVLDVTSSGGSKYFYVDSGGVARTAGDLRVGNILYVSSYVNAPTILTGAIEATSVTGTKIAFANNLPAVITNSYATSSINLINRATASQTGDLLQYQNSSSAILSGVNANGQLYQMSNGYAVTLDTTTNSQANALALRVPADTNASDTICLQTLANCASNGANTSSAGTANYVARFTGTSTLGTGVLYDSGTYAGANITSQLGGATFGVQAASGAVGLAVQGASGQDIADFRSSVGTIVAYVTSGGSLFGFTGQFTQTAAANNAGTIIANTTNTNTSATTDNVSALRVNLTGTANSNAINNNNGLYLNAVSPVAGNVFNGIYAGTGYNSILSYNGNTVLDGTASNLTLGQGGSTSGALVLNNSANSNAVTLKSATSQANVLALSIPADSNTSDTICLQTLANCASNGANTTSTGTANYVARFTGTNTLGTGVLYDNGTFAGAGISSQLGGATFGVQAASGAVGLAVQGDAGSDDIADFKSNAGVTKVSISSAGNLAVGAAATFTTNGNGATGYSINTSLTNTNTAASSSFLSAYRANLTGTSNSNGNYNTLNAFQAQNVSALSGNTFNALETGTGYNSILDYNNGTSLISGAGKLQIAALDSTLNYSNLQNVTNLNVTGNLAVTGTSTYTGGATFNGGVATSGETNSGTLTVTGATILNSALTVKAIGPATAAFILKDSGGSNALEIRSGTAADKNTFIGISSGANNTSGSGINNASLGYNTLAQNTTGASNVAIGSSALSANTTGSSNVAIGYSALSVASGVTNSVAIGTAALQGSSGGNNTAIGYNALQSSAGATGANNTAIGFQAGTVITTGSNETLQGYKAGVALTTGGNNTFIGTSAGVTDISGANNVYLGAGAGYTATGANNVFLGYNAGYNETGSNKLYIANSNTATPLIGGDFSASSVTINGSQTVTGALQGKAGIAIGAASTTTGLLTLYNAANANAVTLSTASQANALALTIPADANATDTVCLQTLGNCNGGSGNGNYIQNGTSQQASANFNISGNGTVGGNLLVSGTNSANQLLVRNSGGANILSVDTTNNQLVLGNITTVAGSVAAGKLLLADGTTDNYGLTLLPSTLTGNRTYLFPNSSSSSDTICLVSLGNCSGSNGGSGNGNYIQNGTSQQAAAFNILGTSTTLPVATIQAASNQHGTSFQVLSNSGNATLAATGDGNVSVGNALTVGNTTAVGGAYLSVTNAGAVAAPLLGLKEVSGQTGDLQQFFNASSTLLGGFNAAGRLYLQTGSYTTTLSTATQANNLALNIPADTNATDTICLQTLANCSGSGASAIGSLDGGTANANGATIASSTLYLQSASASYAGLVNTVAQTFAGAKTFSGALSAGSTLGVTGLATINGGANLTSASGVALTVTGAAGSSDIADFAKNGGTIAVKVDQYGNLVAGAGSYTLSTASAGAAALIVNATNSNTSNTANDTVNGQTIVLTGTANSNVGSNYLTGLYLNSVTPVTNNSFAGINLGTGYNSFLNYNGTSIINGTGKLQNAGLDSSLNYSNLQNVTSLTATGNVAVTGTTTLSGNTTEAGSLAVQGSGGLSLGASTTTTGLLTFFNSANANAVTIGSASQANAVALTIPADANATDTICLQTLNNCTGTGAPVSGSGSYIQNGTSQQTSANFNIDGNGTVGGTLTTPTIQSGSTLTIQANGTNTLALGTTGAGTVTVANSNATSVLIANNAIAHTVSIASGAANQTLTIGSTSGTSSTLIQGGSGNIQLFSSASTVVKSATNSTTAFQVQDASGTVYFNDDTTTGALTIGSVASGNYLSYTAAGGLVANGTSRHTKSISLGAEYAGGVLDAASDSACATANNGTMTSGFDATSFHNYYKWVSGAAAQCYDVVVRVPVPADFGSWSSSTPITLSTYSNNISTGTVNIAVNDTSNAMESGCNYASVTPGTASTWSSQGSSCSLSGTYTAGGVMTIHIRLSGASGSDTRIGGLGLSYNSKY